MTGGSATARIREYVAVLRGMGLTEPAIAEAHGGRERPEGSLVSYLESELPDTDEQTLHESLLDAVANSPRGIDAPPEYWNHAPEVHMGELLAPYGCTLSLDPANDADTLAEGRFAIRLTDAADAEYWTRFEYPESPLGEDNYPALVDTVDDDLLSAAGLTVVRLTSTTARWRFAMMTTEQLSALQERYGERLEIFGAPLLSADQPEAFDSEVPPVPSWYDTSETEDSDDGELSIEVPETESLDDVDAEGVEIEFDDMGSSAESIVEAVEHGGGGAGSTAAVTGDADVEASDDQIESVFGDLSDVSLEAEEPEPASQPSTNGAVAIDGGTATAGSEADEPMDDLFTELERDLADAEPETGEHASGGHDAEISELVDDPDPAPGSRRADVSDLVADTDPEYTLNDPGEEHSHAHGGTARGGRSGSESELASELFDGLARDRRST